jgi:hypothetical protein
MTEESQIKVKHADPRDAGIILLKFGNHFGREMWLNVTIGSKLKLVMQRYADLNYLELAVLAFQVGSWTLIPDLTLRLC